MKKGLIITLIVVGSALLLAGGALFAVGIANNIQNNKIVTTEHVVTAFSKINVDISVSDLEFKVSSDNAMKVVCNEKEKLPHAVEVKDDTLSIKSTDTRKWYERLFDYTWNRTSVTVYVPSKDFVSGTIRTSVGNIVIPSDYSFSNLSVILSTGDIKLNADVKETLTVESSTGNLTIESKAKNMNLKSSVGNQTLKNVTAEEIHAKASVGNIQFIDCDATSLIDVETSTGDVDMTLLSGKTFETHTSVGKVNVPSSTVGAPLCKIKTSTGDIRVSTKS